MLLLLKDGFSNNGVLLLVLARLLELFAQSMTGAAASPGTAIVIVKWLMGLMLLMGLMVQK